MKYQVITELDANGVTKRIGDILLSDEVAALSERVRDRCTVAVHDDAFAHLEPVASVEPVNPAPSPLRAVPSPSSASEAPTSINFP